MKIIGIVICVIGGLLLLSALSLAITKYDLQSTHDISKLSGGFAGAIAALAIGIWLVRRSNKAD